MAKLNQIIAIANGVKSRAQGGLTELYHKLQKPELLSGIARTYRPKDDDGEQLPPESKRVQVRVSEALEQADTILANLFDIVATQDYANCTAMANVTVDGAVILHDVPVTYLLFLEKQLVDIATLVSKLPTLDPAYEWNFSNEADAYVTRETETTRTKKILRNHVKAEATKEHPAQVDVYTEDVIVGYWSKVDFSGAIPASRKKMLVARVRALQDAVKSAREEANSSEAAPQHVGGAVFGYLFS